MIVKYYADCVIWETPNLCITVTLICELIEKLILNWYNTQRCKIGFTPSQLDFSFDNS